MGVKSKCVRSLCVLIDCITRNFTPQKCLDSCRQQTAQFDPVNRAGSSLTDYQNKTETQAGFVFKIKASPHSLSFITLRVRRSMFYFERYARKRYHG